MPSVKSIIRKKQYSTVFKDTRELAKVIAAMVGGKKVVVTDTKTHNNKAKLVLSYRLKPVRVDLSNCKQILVGSGYIKQ